MRGSQELLDIKEDSEDYSGIPSIAISLDKDLEKVSTDINIKYYIFNLFMYNFF